MKHALLFMALLITNVIYAQTTITITKKRPPQLNIEAYKKIAVGDIVGSGGIKTDRSMDLSDAISSELFNDKTFEVVDRNALADILSSQRGSEIKSINETTTAALSKKLSSALLIVGRIQNEKVYTEQKSVKNGIVVNGCYNSYWWELTGDITAQIKIIDVRTGKLLFSNPVIQKINLKTKQQCDPYKLGDTEPLLQETNKQLAHEISKIIIPYDEEMTIAFEMPMFSMFKNPFKKLPIAIQDFKANNNDDGLAILKAYAEDKSAKDNIHEKAVYNYAVGLFVANRYDEANEQFKTAAALGSLNAVPMIEKVATEKQYSSRVIAKSK